MAKVTKPSRTPEQILAGYLSDPRVEASKRELQYYAGTPHVLFDVLAGIPQVQAALVDPIEDADVLYFRAKYAETAGRVAEGKDVTGNMYSLFGKLPDIFRHYEENVPLLPAQVRLLLQIQATQRDHEARLLAIETWAGGK